MEKIELEHAQNHETAEHAQDLKTVEHAQDLESKETQEQPKEAKEAKDTEKLREVELRTVRNEQYRRIMLRSTYIHYSFAAFGATVVVGVHFKEPTILLLFPFAMLWMATLWRNNADMIMRLRGYIAKHIESQDYQWERTLQREYNPLWNFDLIIMVLFICGDLIALGLGIAQNSNNIVLIILSSLCVLLAAFILFARQAMITERVDASPF
jgi:hypothetical protein